MFSVYVDMIRPVEIRKSLCKEALYSHELDTPLAEFDPGTLQFLDI